jgi:hypothetical protein
MVTLRHASVPLSPMAFPVYRSAIFVTEDWCFIARVLSNECLITQWRRCNQKRFRA